MFRLKDIACLFHLKYEGDGDVFLDKILPINEADSSSLAFVSKRKYIKNIENSRAGAVITNPDWVDNKKTTHNFLLTDEPYLIFAKIQQLFYPKQKTNSQYHQTATKGKNCAIGKKCQIDAGVVIGNNVKIGTGTIINSNTSIADNVEIGENCHIYPNVVIYKDCVIKNNVTIHSGVIIGADGFGYAWDKKGEDWLKIPQIGNVVIKNNVEIGANTTIDRGTITSTIIGEGVILDNQIQIGHNVKIGAKTAIAACSAIAGSTTVGKHCQLGGAVRITGHLDICDNTILYAGCRVVGSITKPGVYNSGTLHQAHNEWAKNAIYFKNIKKNIKKQVAIKSK
jgi:UDP-3-O-[3-hydroxymyristoyl] glucosamine N-acyltransferase